MNVNKLRNFLDRPNNALFITGALEQHHWLAHPNSVLWVNHNGRARRILGAEETSAQRSSQNSPPGNTPSAKPNEKGEVVLWQNVQKRLANDLRAIPQGYVTLASFDASPNSPEPLRTGNSYTIEGMPGSENPFVTTFVTIVLLVTLAYNLIGFMQSKDTPKQLAGNDGEKGPQAKDKTRHQQGSAARVGTVLART